MTNVINTRVISLTPTITRHTQTYVGVFAGCPRPPIPPWPRSNVIFNSPVLTAIRARGGIFFSLVVRPQVFFGRF